MRHKNARILLVCAAALSLAALLCISSAPGTSPGNCYKGLECDCIWSNDYSAFPSIVKFQGKYYVSFREAKSHIFDENGKAEGKARILVSRDGKKWKSVALLAKEGYDLRDPKLSVTPDGRLMVTMGGSIYIDRELKGFIPQVSFSSDGRTFSAAEPVVFDERITDDREWIWRVTWYDGTGYGVTYGEHFALVKTLDGVHYDTVCELDLDRKNAPGESTVRFTPDGKMLMMVRCDQGDEQGRWGVSEAPYADWTWTTIPMHLGGPDFIRLEDGTIVAGTRIRFADGQCKTIVLKGSEDGKFEEMFLAPSGGDTSYPGFIEVGDRLWMVYYSCHEKPAGFGGGTLYDYSPDEVTPKASIYLLKMPKSLLK